MLLLHSQCTVSAQAVYSQCTVSALSVDSWCTTTRARSIISRHSVHSQSTVEFVESALLTRASSHLSWAEQFRADRRNTDAFTDQEMVPADRAKVYKPITKCQHGRTARKLREQCKQTKWSSYVLTRTPDPRDVELHAGEHSAWRPLLREPCDIYGPPTCINTHTHTDEGPRLGTYAGADGFGFFSGLLDRERRAPSR